MSTALERVNQVTGETVSVVEFNMSDYLASVSATGAIETQQRLAAAYDTACRALIGPNDVQKEGSREFKKKSAWRKLARHFNISTEVVNIKHEETYAGNNYFLAMVTVRAKGPWGQSADAVGACCTDEATGRRVITIADAIATAETRATNRAVSNLIAMGEVSAEEMSGKGSGERTAPADDRPPAEKRMPFGKSKGTALGDLPDDELKSAAAWCREKNKFLDLAAACAAVLDERENNRTEGDPFEDEDLF